MNSTLFDKVKKLCSEHDINITQLESSINLGKSSILKWKTSNPSYGAIVKVAKYFDVSADYLIGLTEDAVPTITDNDIITIHRARSKMSTEDKTEMMSMLRNAFDYAFEEDRDDDTI